MTKTIFIFLFALLSLCFCNQKSGQVQAQSLSKPVDKGGYYRNIYLDLNSEVINNDADSIVVRTYETVQQDGKTVKGELKDTKICIVNRGDTIEYSRSLTDNIGYLSLRKYYQPVFGADWIEGDERLDTEYETAISPNLHVRKRYRNGAITDSTVIEFYKDKLVESFFYRKEKAPHMVSSVKFDKNDNVIEIYNKSEMGTIIKKFEYDENGIWQRLTGSWSDSRKKIESQTVIIKTKLNERGDWIEMSICEGSECGAFTEREIFYKN